MKSKAFPVVATLIAFGVIGVGCVIQQKPADTTPAPATAAPAATTPAATATAEPAPATTTAPTTTAAPTTNPAAGRKLSKPAQPAVADAGTD